MKKIISIKLLLFFSFSTLVTPFLYSGKREFKNIRYKKDRKTLECNKFLCRVNKKERKRKNKQELFLGKLSKKNRARNKFLHNMVSNSLSDSHISELRRGYSNVNEDCDCNSEKIKNGGIHISFGAMIPMFIFMFLRATLAQSYLPLCLDDIYKITIYSPDLGYKSFDVPCHCTPPNIFGVEYLQCELAFEVFVQECKSGPYDLTIEYEPFFSLHTDVRCECSLFETTIGYLLLDCGAFGPEYSELSNELTNNCMELLRRGAAESSLENTACCDAVHFITDENNITSIYAQCGRIENSATKKTAVFLSVVVVGIPASLLFGCVAGALGACGIKALCALKKRHALRDKVEKESKAHADKINGAIQRSYDLACLPQSQTSTEGSSEYSSTSFDDTQSEGITASETESVTEYDTTESSSSNNSDEDLEEI